VRRTGDGRIVLVHDARVRLRPVGRLEHHQLQAHLKLGQAPLLEDVLSVAAGRIIVDVELKEDGYVDAAMAAITQHLAPDQFVVTSFRPAVLARTGLFGWAERQRLAIWVWTVNEQRVLRALGNDPRVAAVITDRPSRALDVYKPLTRPTAGSRLSTSWEREPPGA
jgi:glycerophosphoryl diester phosphodiesterase